VTTRQARVAFGHAGLAAVLLLGAFCVPALASSSIGEMCADTDQASLPAGHVTPATAELASHTDAAIEDMLADNSDETQESTRAVAEVASDTPAKERDKSPSVDAAAIRSDDLPGIATRLPGVPESTVPSYRRQMFRTDI
jgi:hypothetical protein